MAVTAHNSLTLRTLPVRVLAGFVFALLLFLAGTTLAHAQATRTWVSGVGDDANPCSRTAPCKTFAGAISKTAPSGEIDTLDPGGFGAVTITKAITIDCTPGWGSVLVQGVSAIVVNAGASDMVVVRGCALQGLGPSASGGLNGIRFIGGAGLFVENVVIQGFVNSHGIDFEPGAAASLYVTNSVIRDNTGSGVFVKASGGTANVSIDGTRLENNGVGVNAQDNARVTVRDSFVANNGTAGLQARPSAGSAELNAESVVVTFNGVGVQSGGGGGTGTVRLSNTMIVDNTTGIAAASGSGVLSFLNNRIAGNTASDGAPTATTPQQ